ncbi:MAG: hypothetical protein MUF23_12595 [Pirellula sp.]|jgi:uncharacterized protein YxjI|nr:hypothetical protein [Pirellula sp.]
MQYPLEMRFKLFALSQQIAVSDATGKSILYVKQKMFRLKEKVEVYSDSNMQQKLFEINADRMLDFTANYSFRSTDGSDWGSVRREGMKSLWSAHYDVYEEGRIDMSIREEEPWKRFVESILGEIPLVGFIAIYLLNPSYIVTMSDGTAALRVIKKPSVFERYFVIEKLAELDEDDELRALLSLITMVILEKSRG